MRWLGENLRVPTDYTGFAVIGGSGAWDLVREELGGWREEEVLALDTPFGAAARLDFFRTGTSGCFAFMSRHGLRGYQITAGDVNYRANIWALKLIGTRRIFAWSGPGAVNTRYSPGDYVLPDDLLDLTRLRPGTFLKGTGLGFIRQNPVFCPDMRSVLLRAAGTAGRRVHDGGVYAVTEGPRLETAAEVRMIGSLGGDLVGMTLAPECFLARELEMCYHPVCYVTNWAEGVRDLPYRPGELFEGMLEPELKQEVDRAVAGFARIAGQAAQEFASVATPERTCPCASAMLRYRRAGRISTDWEGWIRPE